MVVFRNNYGIVLYEGVIYVVGGIIEDGSVIRVVELFDLRINIWFILMFMRKEVVGVGVIMLGDFFYVIGGRDVEGWL